MNATQLTGIRQMAEAMGYGTAGKWMVTRWDGQRNAVVMFGLTLEKATEFARTIKGSKVVKQ